MQLVILWCPIRKFRSSGLVQDDRHALLCPCDRHIEIGGGKGYEILPFADKLADGAGRVNEYSTERLALGHPKIHVVEVELLARAHAVAKALRFEHLDILADVLLLHQENAVMTRNCIIF